LNQICTQLHPADCIHYHTAYITWFVCHEYQPLSTRSVLRGRFRWCKGRVHGIRVTAVGGNIRGGCPSNQVVVCENGNATLDNGEVVTCKEACDGSCCIGGYITIRNDYLYAPACEGLTASICKDNVTWRAFLCKCSCGVHLSWM
jgi:hypothetical protein